MNNFIFVTVSTSRGMEDKKTIEHEGIVREIRDGKIWVSFVAKSACAHCHLSSYCSAADLQDKEVEIWQDNQRFSVGDKVNIVLEQSLGFRALLLGYVIPFFIVVTGLFLALEITGNELISGLVSLGLLVPWYVGLYLTRSGIRKQFQFRIRKPA